MKVLILGIDGYIGWSLALYLKKKGHFVKGVDDYSRRASVHRVAIDSLTPIANPYKRDTILESNVDRYSIDGQDYDYMVDILLDDGPPDAIFHLAEQPSAPYSMMDAEHAIYTQSRNVLGTLSLLWAMKEACPNAHLIKIGTMGEYGTPECDIPEGRIEEYCSESHLEDDVFGQRQRVSQLCPMKGLLFPRTAGSFYHLSKVHDTHNIEFACRNWGLRSTDIMQGIVFGLNETDKEEELTRFDYDEHFGTVLNRFCAQAIIGMPLTVYGEGGQTRGFLPLKDSIQCLEIALNNPPESGEYRTWNQFENVYPITEVAEMVAKSIRSLDIGNYGAKIVEHIPNPRKEAESHYYNPAHQKLFDLGYVPTTDIQGEITSLISRLMSYKSRIHKEVIMPTTKWR